MKKIKKTITTISLLAAPTLAVSPALTSCANNAAVKEVHILDINDVHGAMAGYGEDVVNVSDTTPGCLRLAKEVNTIINKYPGSVFLSAGDENSGDSWSVCTQGKSTYPILKSMGIRYAAVGNHAFEWGMDDMASGRYDTLARTDKTEGNYFVASNILYPNIYQNKQWCIDPTKPEFAEDYKIWKNQRVSWADPYKILDMGKGTVCLIGLATRNTWIDGNKKITQQLSFADYNASINYTKYLIKEELGNDEFKKIDSFILLTHLDSDYKDKILSGEAIQLAATVDTDIDGIISAHSHKTGCGKIYNNILNKPIWIGQAGTAGKAFLDTKLVFNSKAKRGNRLESIGMEVKEVPIKAKTSEEATTEWNQLLNSTDPDIKPVADAYKAQKETVRQQIGTKLSEAILKKDTVCQQHPDKFDGYYNGIKYQGTKFQPGHDFYDCEAILDHFSGWMNRATILGFAIRHWEEIENGELPIPSVAFSTQDSAPAQVASGDITLKNMFDVQPHENQLHLFYLNIFQIANIFNYGLAGKPHGEDIGFNYVKRNTYIPDLNFFLGIERDSEQKIVKMTPTRVAYEEKDEKRKPLTQSAYTCGMLTWYGIRVKLTEISAEEKAKTFKNPDTQIETACYDKTAKYRVSTSSQKVTIGGVEQDVILPDMWIYDSSRMDFGSIDDPKNADKWHPASWWYEKQMNPTEEGKIRLIPALMNTFSFNGGNDQCKMFKPYSKYNVLNYGIDFAPTDTSETCRDLITDFCNYSTPDTHEWSQFIVPTNINWDIVKALAFGFNGRTE